jgi:AP-4 complex subunit epsilon-1
MAVIDCLEDPDETLKLKTLELLVTMTKANNVQVCLPLCIGWEGG